jgi:hypothetical protein
MVTITNAINANSVTPLAITNGGTGEATASATPVAGNYAAWNVNSNLSANNFIPGYATTATSGATTTLTVGSAYRQFFTGTMTQIVVMPVTSTLVLGQSWLIANYSTQPVTIQSSGANTIVVLPTNTECLITCVLTSGTTAASWSYVTNSSTQLFALNVQTFTTSGTYTPTAGMQYCIIEAWSGGGGGGGAAAAGVGEATFGAGGGTSGYSRLLTTAATIGASQTVTISSGGTGGIAGANPGGNSGTTSVGVLCVANGGIGGGPSNSVGGNGGAVGTGDIAAPGTYGLAGYLSTINTVSVLAGQGGSTLIGSGGNTRTSSGTGNSASGFGAGGAGGLSAGGGGTQAGGDGAPGFIIITEYI